MKHYSNEELNDLIEGRKPQSKTNPKRASIIGMLFVIALLIGSNILFDMIEKPNVRYCVEFIIYLSLFGSSLLWAFYFTNKYNNENTNSEQKR